MDIETIRKADYAGTGYLRAKGPKGVATEIIHTPELRATLLSKIDELNAELVIVRKQGNLWHNQQATTIRELQIALDVALTPTEQTAGLITRAFWRRVHMYKDDYGKELPRDKVPTPLLTSMMTALLHLRLQGQEVAKRIDEMEVG